jgi:adenine phosphoribosyltransferase
MDLSSTIRNTIREIPDFPKKGISFKDITPLLAHAVLSGEIATALLKPFLASPPDVIIGIESRGFLYGMLMAQHLSIPFVPVRKQGKLPAATVSHGYQLEYGEAILEMHSDAIHPGMRVLVHDDLLATGGTCEATAILVEKLGGKVAGFSFIIELDFLEGRKKLLPYAPSIHSLTSY